MSEFVTGSIVKCAECFKSTEIESVNDYDGKVGYFLDCGHRNTYCSRCNKLARDVSDTGSEICIFCDECETDDPELLDWENSQKKRRWANSKPSLEEIRKKYKRASYKWSDDEMVAVGLYINKIPKHKISTLFDREPNTVTHKRSLKSKFQLSNDCLIRILGRNIQCQSCQYEIMLTYRHFELVAEKISIRVLELKINDVAAFAKCSRCGEKNFKVMP